MTAVAPTKITSEPGLSVAAAARRLGIAPATLRTWDRRYGIGPSQRTAGAHRRYTAEDLAALTEMLRLITAGMPPGDAAKAATSQPPGNLPADGRPGSAATRATSTDSAAVIGPAAAQRGLSRAGSSLDADAACDVVRRCLNSRGVVWTWDNVLLPVLQAVGERFSQTGEGIEVEHLLSGAIQRELATHMDLAGSEVNPRPVLIAAAEEELHVLPMHALAAALAERQIQSRLLGARVPLSALTAAIKRIGPSVVFVWAQTERDLQELEPLAATRPAPLIMPAGPGWRGETSLNVIRPTDLSAAVCAIATAVRA